MAIIPKILDPVRGLIDYTLAIKPYHTKIIEILEEYIHTDFILVRMEDKVEFCINLGYPNLNTIFSRNIIDINFSNNSVIIKGQVGELIHSGQRVQIEFSSQNNGSYYISDIIFNEFENISEIIFKETLTSDIADGQLVNSTIEYCLGNDKSTNVLELSPIFCDDGYGNIYDSFLELVFQIDIPNNEIIIGGDHTFELSNATTVQLINELLNEPINPGLNDYWINNDTLLQYNGIDWITLNSTLIKPINPNLNDYWINNNVLLQYQSVGINQFDWIILPSSHDNDIVGVFHIDSYNFNGINTSIKVIENISTFQKFNINNSHKLLIKYIGYDDVVRCNLTNDPNASETLFVNMKENLSFDISMNFSDKFLVYNMENSYESRYDSIGIGHIVSATQPNVPESLIQPINPNIFDLWYDLNVQVLKQWQNFEWVSIKYAYWYQEDPLNDQNSTYYKLIKNKFVDSGWLVVDPLLNDNLNAGYDQEPYSVIKNNYYHPTSEIQVDVPLNGLFLFGGDFTPLLVHNLTIRSYDNSSFAGNINHASYNIESYGTNTITLSQTSGDLTNIFVSGVSFNIEDPTLVNKSYNVLSSIFDGTNTIITLNENIVHNNFNNTTVGSIPAVFYIQPNTLGNISGTSTLIILNSPINANIQSIEYLYYGPLQLSVDMFRSSNILSNFKDELLGYDETSNILLTATKPGIQTDTTTGDQFQTSITDEIIWSWGNIIDWFQYYIISFPQPNEIILAGNALSDIQIGQQFRIIGNTPNAGIYSVLLTLFDGINTTVTINETINPLELGGYIEPVDILPIRIILEDTISATMIEDTTGGLLDTSGNLIQSQDFKYFDISGYDSALAPNKI